MQKRRAMIPRAPSEGASEDTSDHASAGDTSDGARRRRGLATRAVHAGERGPAEVPPFTPTTLPIHPSASYGYEALDDLHAVFETQRGYCYTRHANPTTDAFERSVAALEASHEPARAVAFGSGMAAIHAGLVALGARAGARVVASRDLYGATITLLREHVAKGGVDVSFVDLFDEGALDRALDDARARPTVLLFEVVSNPLLRVLDAGRVIALARARGAAVLVDNTFATAFHVRPLELGADVVIHSATKYLGGHGDATGGVACTLASRPELERALRMALRFYGAVLGPFEAWTLARGVRTFPLRMQRHAENAAALAARLEGHPRLARVHYPGLASHPTHEVARRVMERGFGGMLALELCDATCSDAVAFMERLELAVPATTLGDVTSLVLSPALTSHRALSDEERALVGISPGLVRMSVGIEDVDDLEHDVRCALRG
jgi:cystathionine beta-lyase/cystathionine gamma-synthase